MSPDCVRNRIINYDLDITNILVASPQFRYIEVFDITNPPFNEQIWPVPSDFVKSRFHCINFYKVVLNVFLFFLVIPVKLGIIGVMNRSQLDINNKKVSIIKTTQFTIFTNRVQSNASLHYGLSFLSTMEARQIRSTTDHNEFDRINGVGS